ncbi:MAG: hypothetical protein ER33_14735 [Cyanobium sp. CACIAM 14]|nr:MAG: hypothetical protein ER33_14735 [Cyanobium sp. CACIAM 14]
MRFRLCNILRQFRWRLIEFQVAKAGRPLDHILGAVHAASSVSAPMLDHMRELVSQQSQSRGCTRHIMTSTEDDIAPDGKGQGVDCLSCLRSFCVRMDPYSAEAVAETRLHQAAGRRIKRLAG